MANDKKRTPKPQKLSKDELKQLESEAFLIQHGISVYERSVTFNQQGIKDRWLRGNAQYNSKFVRTIPKGENSPNKSEIIENSNKLFIPKTYTHIQRMLGDIMGALFFDPEEIVDVKANKDMQNAFEQAMITKALLNYRLNSHPVNFYQEALEFVQDALRNMIGIFKTYPQFKLDKDGEILQFDPIIEAVPYEDMFFSPEATWKDYYKYPIVHRSRRRFDELRALGYKNLDQVQEAMTSHTDEIKQQREDLQGSPFVNTEIDGIKENELYVYEIWTFLDKNNDGRRESVKYLMAGSENSPTVVISDIETNDLPFKRRGDLYNRPPFIVGTSLPESHQMYGKSYPELTESLQREVNAIRNQKREAVALSIRSPLLVNSSSNIDLNSLMNRRMGGIVMGDDVTPNSVRELTTNTNFDGSYNELSISNNDFDQITSVSPNRLGIGQKGEQTATEVQALEGNANASMNQVTRNIVVTGIIPCFENLLRMEQEYETDEFIQKVTGESLGWGLAKDENPTREIIEGDFTLDVQKGQGKQALMNKFMTMLQMSNQANATTAQLLQTGVLQPQDASFVNPGEIIKRIMLTMGEKGQELFVPAQAPPPQEGAGVAGVASQAAPTGEANIQGGQFG